MFVSAAPNPRQLILNLLLASAGEPLAVRDLVTSCALFGIRDNSVRVTLTRLVAAGLIEPSGRGAYQLGPNAATLAADVSTWRTAEQRVRDWPGSWIIAHVGGLGRSDRVALRARSRALDMLGMRELDAGLWVRPDNLVGGVERVRARLYALGLPPTAAVFQGGGFDAERDERARALWDGKALSKAYRASRLRLERFLSRAQRRDTQAAARELYLLGNDAIRQLVFDPLLPAPLVDVAERARFVDMVERFDRAGRAVWRRLHEERRPAEA